ncbi:MAG: enoyl-CoA hydratase/isomerase family protein [Acidimicrobiia bacterium]
MLQFEKSPGGIATITLNNPAKLNAFDNVMLADWAAALQESQADDAVAVVIVTGAGRAFCSGGDLGTMGEVDGNAALYIGDYLRNHVHPVARAVDALQKPYLGAINGVATGAGMDMALMTDIRYAARSARFAESYIKVGLVPGDGGAFLLPRLVGLTKALELLWTGDFVNAEEAERLGIVSKVCDDDALMADITALAERLAAGPRIAIRLMKQVVYKSLRQDFLGALDFVTGPMGVAFNTADHREAVKAFSEKRTPNFTGR